MKSSAYCLFNVTTLSDIYDHQKLLKSPTEIIFSRKILHSLPVLQPWLCRWPLRRVRRLGRTCRDTCEVCSLASQRTSPQREMHTTAMHMYINVYIHVRWYVYLHVHNYIYIMCVCLCIDWYAWCKTIVYSDYNGEMHYPNPFESI